MVKKPRRVFCIHNRVSQKVYSSVCRLHFRAKWGKMDTASSPTSIQIKEAFFIRITCALTLCGIYNVQCLRDFSVLSLWLFEKCVRLNRFSNRSERKSVIFCGQSEQAQRNRDQSRSQHTTLSPHLRALNATDNQLYVSYRLRPNAFYLFSIKWAVVAVVVAIFLYLRFSSLSLSLSLTLWGCSCTGAFLVGGFFSPKSFIWCQMRVRFVLYTFFEIKCAFTAAMSLSKTFHAIRLVGAFTWQNGEHRRELVN